jgi:hypothetical protein
MGVDSSELRMIQERSAGIYPRILVYDSNSLRLGIPYIVTPSRCQGYGRC